MVYFNLPVLLDLDLYRIQNNVIQHNRYNDKMDVNILQIHAVVTCKAQPTDVFIVRKGKKTLFLRTPKDVIM